MERNHYLFSLNKKNQMPVTIIRSIAPIKSYESPQIVEKVIEGPTGPAGKDGDRFCTKTINKIHLSPEKYDFFSLNVETGLAYISGNSIIVAQVPNTINSDLNTFEGTIQYYNPLSGQLLIKDVTNVHGDFSKKEECYYHVNLDGVDGEQGPPGPPGPPGPQGPPGPSNISEINIPLLVVENTITIPQQENAIAYYTLDTTECKELKNIQSNLKQNQTAILLIKDPFSIFPIMNMNINYNSVITLNDDTSYAIFTLYNIQDILFGECITYYRNTYYINE
jgi:hypothetical protein